MWEADQLLDHENGIWPSTIFSPLPVICVTWILSLIQSVPHLLHLWKWYSEVRTDEQTYGLCDFFFPYSFPPSMKFDWQKSEVCRTSDPQNVNLGLPWLCFPSFPFNTLIIVSFILQYFPSQMHYIFH